MAPIHVEKKKKNLFGNEKTQHVHLKEPPVGPTKHFLHFGLLEPPLFDHIQKSIIFRPKLDIFEVLNRTISMKKMSEDTFLACKPQ